MKSKSKAHQIGHRGYSAVAEQERQGDSPAFSIDDQRPIAVAQRKTNEALNTYTAKQHLPIQRAVDGFSSTTSTGRKSPGDDLKDEINASYFNEDTNTINGNIDQKMLYNGNNLHFVKNLKANVNRRRPNGNVNRSGTDQTSMGHIGRDEFLIRRGKNIMFEGGHIIPLKFWDSNDTDANKANTSENLIPQTRTMNMIDWKGAEDKMDNHYRHQIEIKPTHHAYKVSYFQIANTFGLNVKGNKNGNDTFELWEWMPSKVDMTRKTATGLNPDNSSYKEDSMYQTPKKRYDTGDGADIQTLLNSGYGMAQYFTNAAWKAIGKI